jgi:hypothetical protein
MKFNQFEVELDDDTIVIRQNNTCEIKDMLDEITITLDQLDVFIDFLNKTARGE